MHSAKHIDPAGRDAVSDVSSKEAALDLSVVIIGRNEAAHLSKCIEGAIEAGRLTERPFEIIYVDSASTDDSISIAGRYPISVIRIAPGQWRCAAAGRSIGTRYARGKYLAFLDGDMICDPHWFKDGLSYFDGEYGQVGAVTGRRVNIDTRAGQVCSIRQHYQRVVDMDRFSGAAIISRVALKASRGFDPYLISSEEKELAGRIKDAGFRVLGVPHSMASHYGPTSGISETFRRKENGYHIGLGQYVRRLWVSGKIASALLQIKVQIAFLVWALCMGVVFSASIWLKQPIIAAFCALTIPMVFLAVVFRLKRFPDALFFMGAQPLIIYGVIQGAFRPIPKHAYLPKIDLENIRSPFVDSVHP
jgi:glycosyltransferase involved in cell wall biosynthesis